VRDNTKLNGEYKHIKDTCNVKYWKGGRTKYSPYDWDLAVIF
jgi:hypothetical protein